MNNTVPDCCTKFGINIDIYKCNNKMPKLCIIDLCTDEAKTGWGGIGKMFRCNSGVGFCKSNFFESETLM